MKELIIVGAGGFGRELLELVKHINAVEKKWNIKGFIDDRLNALEQYECDYEVIGTIQDWEPRNSEVFACAIAEPGIKERIVHTLKAKGAVFVPVIHPTAWISEFANIGEGLVAYPYSTIGPNTYLGDFVTLLSAAIGHDAIVGKYTTISTHCDITGGVRLGERVFLGSHASITPGRKVGNDVYVCAGSVVMTNIKADIKVMGCPARKSMF